MKKYKHLFFDLDNTLYDFTLNSYESMKEAFNSLKIIEKLPGFDLFFEEYQKINDLLWIDYREKKVTKEVLRGKRFELSLNKFNYYHHNPYQEIDDVYLKAMPSKTNLFENTIETLTYLKNRGYVLHIITNGFKEVQHAKMENSGISSFFTKVFISEDIKAPKPDKKIFEHALKSSNARKKESLMIGDSIESDIIGAKNFGIDQVYFNFNNNPLNSTITPTFTIKDLKELVNLL